MVAFRNGSNDLLFLVRCCLAQLVEAHSAATAMQKLTDAVRLRVRFGRLTRALDAQKELLLPRKRYLDDFARRQ